MNKERIIIIDDDPGICQILQNIIEDYDLGQVVDLLHDGQSGVELIPKFKPDIVYVDLLLPDIDGIEIVKRMKSELPEIDFIMISQVSDQEMIADAYSSGIDFYITKPINVVEVLSVTRRVIDSQRNRRVLQQIGNTLNKTMDIHPTTVDDSEEIKVIFAELGILSEKGCNDLIEMILYARQSRGSFQMSSLYQYLNRYYQAEQVQRSSSVKAIEQRVRRTIQSAMINMAHLGIEDFGNYKFDRYVSQLFSFQEIKKTMDAIRRGQPLKPTINTKQFITGMMNLLH